MMDDKTVMFEDGAATLYIEDDRVGLRLALPDGREVHAAFSGMEAVQLGYGLEVMGGALAGPAAMAWLEQQARKGFDDFCNRCSDIN